MEDMDKDHDGYITVDEYISKPNQLVVMLYCICAFTIKWTMINLLDMHLDPWN